LKYLLAILEGTLRMHSPAPRGGPRIVPAGGEYVDGIWIPGGVNFPLFIEILLKR
jgi:hypothetical protein